MNQILTTDDPERKDRNTLLEVFTYTKFKEMEANWLQKGRMVWFINGNMTAPTAIGIAE